MKIEHIAIWVKDLEEMRAFYEKYFDATSNKKYTNHKKHFHSYFLTFDEGAKLEIMKMPNIPENKNDIYEQFMGLIHFAIGVGSPQKVDALTEQLRNDGFEIVGKPRTTGDGFYESVVLDPKEIELK